ncbi:MAG: TolC family protein [Ferruginibacter sp.]|nr:TolC family protein [Ferruginibacter sp.]
MTRIVLLSIVFLFTSQITKAQQLTTLTIEQCYRLAINSSPMYQQKVLTIAAGKLAERNLNLQWLPQLDINAQATYQSAVTSLPVKIPNVTIEELDKDQYKGTLELVQPVYDGGVIAGQRKLQRINTATEAQQVEVDLYQLRSAINTYYFTVLLMEKNIQLMNLVKLDLNNSIKTVATQVLNGLATKSNEDLLNAELLRTEQQVIEFGSVKKQSIQNLAILTGANIDEHILLAAPVSSNNLRDVLLIARPELKLFDFQQQSLQLQAKLISAKSNPRVSFFANGGYGKPGLNQLKNEFQWFYITGLKLTIPVMSRITQKKDMAVLKLREQVTSKQKENFLKNNQQLLTRQKNEIDKYQRLVITDSAIITLRKRIKENAFVKLSNGIITTTDYIAELNAENQALLNQKLHEVALLQAQYNYKVLMGD